MIGYIPADPLSGKHLLYIIHVERDNEAYYIYYDFSVGASVGWAAEKYIKTGKWLLCQRIDLLKAQAPLSYLMAAVRAEPLYKDVADLTEAKGCRICADITVHTYHGELRPAVSRTYPASSYTIKPEDIRIGTTNWSNGCSDRTQAGYLAKYTGLPVLLADTQERMSPIIEWCSLNKIIVLPMTFPAGDYKVRGGKTIVDRKQSIVELYHNFAKSDERASYARAADTAAGLGTRLIYIVGTDTEDQVACIDDLAQWSRVFNNGNRANGSTLRAALNDYKRMHSNADFVFVPHNQLCQKIWDTVQE